jgi:hypothetical protein
MAGFTEQELKDRHSIVNEGWQFFKKWAQDERYLSNDKAISDVYWSEAIAETGVIYEKRNRDPLVKDILLAMVGEIERRSKVGAEEH